MPAALERFALDLARLLLRQPVTPQTIGERLVAARGGSGDEEERDEESDDESYDESADESDDAHGLARFATAITLRIQHGRRPRELARLAHAAALRFGANSPQCAQVQALAAGHDAPLRAIDLAHWLVGSARFERLFAAAAEAPPRMRPQAGAPSTWNVPALPTPRALADWLGVPLERLFAWCRTFRPDPERRDARLLHYHHRWLARRHSPPRLLEAPKAGLKSAQRRILADLLAHLPPHAAAHGFVRGRSVASFVAPHTGTACVLRLDVQDFFASLPRARVHALFATAGYPSGVAALLAALCTTATPHHVLASLADHGTAGLALAERLRQPHLPQGAPTSPALANLLAHRLDRRLAGLAARFGACYTRYADDLLFSGGDDFAHASARCATWAAAILQQEGLACAHRKTRVMRASVAQHAGGLVLNTHAAVARCERDRLEAVLTNCVRQGPSTQNRTGVADFRAHLRGRIAHVAHAHAPHGKHLLALFAQIDWTR